VEGLVVREARWWLNENNYQIVSNYSTAVEHFSLKVFIEVNNSWVIW